MERWKEIVGGGKSPQRTSTTIERLLTEVKAFIGEAEQTDDITLLTICMMNEIKPIVLRLPLAG